MSDEARDTRDTRDDAAPASEDAAPTGVASSPVTPSEDGGAAASSAAGAPPPAAHGGQLLREAREAAGLHVAALAVALKVPVRQLEALEQGQFERLPDPTFVRALAGSVCRQLRVDPKPILAALPQAAARSVRVGGGINEPFQRPGMPGGPGLAQLALRPPVLIAAGLLLAALLLLLLPPLFQHEEGEGAAPAASAPAPQSAAPQPAASEAQPASAAAPTQGGMGGLVVEPVQPALPVTGNAPAGRTP